MHNKHKTLALIILDGWGYSEQTEGNAIKLANTPNWDRFWAEHPHSLLDCSGHAVGLPDRQMGNSEVGHLNIGAGRIVQQDFTRVATAIEDGSFYQNPVLLAACDKAIAQNKAVHVLGLLSPGGVHSHEQQILSFIRLAAERGVKKLYIHAFLDGRDTPPKSAAASLQLLETTLSQQGVGKIISICGRYFAMDRDKRWPRIQKAYELIVQGKAQYHFSTALEALQQAYQRGESDEFVEPTIINDIAAAPYSIQDGDTVVFMNYRADRTRQLSRALCQADFTDFRRQQFPNLGNFVTLTQYADDIKSDVAFPPMKTTNTLGECVANLRLKQLRIAETEKYAHVTFFFNGGVETPLPYEERILIPSPPVATYDLQPEMSAVLLTEKIITAINSGQYTLIVANFANADMVGHSGNLPATIKAIETIDQCLGAIAQALQANAGEAIITADHGNAEHMCNFSTGQAHTAHTNEPVPCVYIGRNIKKIRDGSLQDIAPTALYLLNIPKPAEMVGNSLLELM